MDATVDNFRVALPANRNATHPERIFLQGSRFPEALTHSIDEAMAHIRTHAIEKFGLYAGKPPRRRWWLFEKPRFVRAITEGGSG